jgi:glyoxylase-like metal-dependent hydrolase (beta-lactamase superfamily II)
LNDLVFDRSLSARYGVAERLSPHIERVLAPNPGPFTFKGTGVYIVGGGKSVAVIDPGPDLPAHVAALSRALDGRTVSHILITHTHRDHSPAAAALKQATGARTFGFGPHPFYDHLRSGLAPDGAAAFGSLGIEPHPSLVREPATGTSTSSVLRARGGGWPQPAEEAGDRGFAPDVTVRDGDILQGDGFTLECVFTPGHISNHMCYALKEESALFSGDHVMGWSTSVVAPPEGNMADYMASLEKLIARDDAILYPTHGSPIAAPRPYLRALLAHRKAREGQVLDGLAAGLETADALAARLYPDLAPALRRAATLTVQAHLEKLRDEGCASERGGLWFLSD